MKRPGLRPSLEGMLGTPAPAAAAHRPVAEQPGLAVSHGCGPLSTGPGGRVLPRLSESFTAAGPGLDRRSLSMAPSVAQSLASVNQSMHSFLVSASGGMLTLGDHYHVSSSGVAEFKSDERTRELGLTAAGREGSLMCRHISELDFDHGLQIGRGSSGKIYNVVHTPSGTHVCVKQMTIDDAHHRDEIKRELDSLHAAPSRWIVDFHGAFFHHDLGVILLVLELMDGSFRDLLSIMNRLSEQEVKAICVQCLHGLAFLHSDRALIHRDIKPENLLFHRSGRLKITDFGVSRGHRSHDPASVHTFVGSISYMSPERLEGKAYGYEADVWSLGVILCEALTGFHPFQDNFSYGAQKLSFWDLLQKVLAAGGAGPGSPSALEACLQRMSAAGLPPVVASAEMLDFVARCLAFDRDRRGSARDLLQHPWVASTTIEASEAVVAEMVLKAARMKDAESRQLLQVDASPSNAGSSSTVAGSATADALSPSGKTPLMSTPEESRQRGDALLSELIMTTRVGGRPNQASGS